MALIILHFVSLKVLLAFLQNPQVGIPDCFLWCEVLLDHFQAEIFSLGENEIDDWGEDDDEEAEHEKGSVEREVTFQKGEKLYGKYEEDAGDCTGQALEENNILVS